MFWNLIKRNRSGTLWNRLILVGVESLRDSGFSLKEGLHNPLSFWFCLLDFFFHGRECKFSAGLFKRMLLTRWIYSQFSRFDLSRTWLLSLCCVPFMAFSEQNYHLSIKFHQAVLNLCRWVNILFSIFTYHPSEKDGKKGGSRRYGENICYGGTCVIPKHIPNLRFLRENK